MTAASIFLPMESNGKAWPVYIIMLSPRTFDYIMLTHQVTLKSPLHTFFHRYKHTTRLDRLHHHLWPTQVAEKCRQWSILHMKAVKKKNQQKIHSWIEHVSTSAMHQLPALRVLTVSVVMFASLGIGNLSLLLLLLTSIGVSLLPFPFYPLLLLTQSSTRWTFHFTMSASRDGVRQDAVRHACWAEEEAS